jgi:hypothetical protein
LLQSIYAHIPLTLYVLTPIETRRRLAMGDQFLQEIVNKGRVLYSRNGFAYSN